MIWDDDHSYGKTYKYKIKDVFPLVKRPFWGMMLNAPLDTTGALPKTYIVDKCTTNRYNHKYEKHTKSKVTKVPCSELYDRFPFVFREMTSEGIKETLELDGKVLSQWVDKTSLMRNRLKRTYEGIRGEYMKTKKIS